MIMPKDADSAPSSVSRPCRPVPVREALSKVEDHGEWSIEKIDEANIPVNLVLSAPDDYSEQWILLADNFKPCNSQVDVEIYEIRANSREALIHTLIVPLYQNAVNQLSRNGSLFFWSEETPAAKP